MRGSRPTVTSVASGLGLKRNGPCRRFPPPNGGYLRITAEILMFSGDNILELTLPTNEAVMTS